MHITTDKIMQISPNTNSIGIFVPVLGNLLLFEFNNFLKWSGVEESTIIVLLLGRVRGVINPKLFFFQKKNFFYRYFF